ncbi:Oligoxyloglucan reducing end-specific cellobiohydrolase [Testicularia cyperi]|uniref:Oligoxyloglucan reducing end-specific cellobiohydrolase n=1 Tax=Testicularia cyperi TaxID=1882483 RepID=A0A317XHM9_9BASI|nr:Oligoxyloglucan reducing end-specific cellobiohydrolase [Testicularia cyperi]
MKFFKALIGVAGLAMGLVSASPLQKRDFGPVTIFTPPSTYTNERTLYARSLMLTVNDNAGTLLTTWENYSGGVTWFPIYRSTDHGYTWTAYSNVTDQVNGWGLRYQPHLYELTTAFAGYPAGSILLAGNSIPADLSKTQLDLYISTDKGKTWTFLSHIAAGGKAVPNNGETPVWEPFLLLNNGQLICYYSDQRDSAYGQKIVHQTTTDLKTWSAVVNDVTEPAYSARPGMPVVSQMGDQNWIMTYEYGGAPEANFAVYYKISNDPTSWSSKTQHVLKATDGTVPTSSPYNIWTPVGTTTTSAVNGTVVVSAYSDGGLYVNRKNADPSAWTRLAVPNASAGYSRSLARGFKPKDIVILNAGSLGAGSTNKVAFSARDVNGCSTC